MILYCIKTRSDIPIEKQKRRGDVPAIITYG